MEASIPCSELLKTTEGDLKNADTKPNDREEKQVEKPAKKAARRFQCSVCDKLLCNKQVLQYHEATHAVPAVQRQCFRCDVCGASFTSRTGRNNHMKNKHTENGAEAKPTDQDQKQNSEDDYFPSETKPAKKHRFQCKICDKIVASKQSLQNHEARHVDPAIRRQDLRCEICGASFTSSAGLKYHLNTKHIENRESLPCPKCERVFKSAEGRKIHMTIQHGEGPVLKCQECPMVFARKAHLDLHMTTHGSGLHVCTLCGKPYARLKDLAKHEASCADKGPIQPKTFRCGQCSEAFATAVILRNHQKTMHGETGCEEEPKVRMRRSKYDLYLGLEHLADPSKIIEKVAEPTKDKPTPPKPTPFEFQCEHCPRKFGSKQGQLNHGMRRHWKAFGLAEPLPERRGRKRTRPEGPRKRKSRRKVFNFVDAEKLPAEADTDTEDEVDDPVESYGFCEDDEYPAEDGSSVAESDVEDAAVVEKPATSPTPVKFQCELIEPLPEARRGRKRTRPEGSRKRKGRRKISNLVDVKTLPEIKDDKNAAEAFSIKSEAEEVEISSTIDTVENTPIPVEELSMEVEADDDDVAVNSRHDPVDNIAFCETPNFDDEFNLIEGIEDNIKQEIIELGDFQLADLENGLHDDPAELKLENVVVDEPTVQTQVSKQHEDDAEDSDESDEPFDEPEQPQITRELVIRLVKLDYFATETVRVRKVQSRGKNPFPRTNCEHCGQTFAYQYRLALHRIKEHGSTETAVPNRILGTNTKSRNFRCDQCDKTYHREYSLALHKAKVHGIGEKIAKATTNVIYRSCKHCHKKFNSWGGLVYHLKFKHGETIDYSKIHQCPSCHAYFILAEEMEKHLCARKNSTEDHSFKCDLCGKGFSTQIQKENHFKLFPEYQHVKCDQCAKGFCNETQLNLHKSTRHKPEDARFRCSICQKLLASQNNLKLHMKYHEADQPICEQCGQQFESKRLLSCHVYFKHTMPLKAKTNPEDPRPCPTCGKMCKSKTALRLHIKMHTIRIKCTFCDKVFYSNASRKIHEQSHTKDYKFKCNVCDYGTVKRKTILEHEQQKHNYNRFANSNSDQ